MSAEKIIVAFTLGERVRRRVDVFDRKSKWRTGEVYQRYSDGKNYPELYTVLWDDGQLESGFLPHGLESDPRPKE